LQKVREAVEKTGYVPNLLAGGLASNKSRLVAVVVPTVIGPVFQEIVHTLTETLAAAATRSCWARAATRIRVKMRCWKPSSDAVPMAWC
jgi:DNA-binding LacI/PurR family transcriptional regulator